MGSYVVEVQTHRDLRPTWLHKSWQVLWNWNDHNQNHGTALHHDKCDAYSSTDPNTSLSFGRGGVLMLGLHIGREPTRMLFQEDGDALVMARDFQKEFCHGVPVRGTWQVLKDGPMYTGMKLWGKEAMTKEIDMHGMASQGAPHATIRWRDTHFDPCPVN